jgi:WD40 repeat protein
MRRLSRPTPLAISLVGLLLAGAALAGCSEESDANRGDPSAGVPEGDIPSALVLPDDLAVSRDGSQVLADCWPGVCRWDTKDGNLAQVDEGSHVALSPDWSVIAGVGDDASIELVDTDSGDVVHELAGHQDEEITDGSPILDIAFSPDGELVASAGLDGEVIVWTVNDGTEVATIETDHDVAALAFSPDGRFLATGGDGAPIDVFDIPSGDPVTSLPGSEAVAPGLAWSPDGRWLAGPGPDGAPAVWDTESFALVDRLAGQSLERLAFAPDSRTLAVTDAEDATVRLWSPGAESGGGRAVTELQGHIDEPGAVAFSPDGATLYSVAATDGVFAWDVETGRLTHRFELPDR